MKSLNLVMIVKNEENTLGRCLEQVKDLVDGIVIADTGSTDRTRQIAESFGAKVFEYEWNDDFSAARNFALSHSDADWNLCLDADEYLTSGTREELAELLERKEVIGTIMIKSGCRDEEDGISYSTQLISRLLPRGVGYTGTIHEQVDSTFPRIAFPLAFNHDGYMKEGKAERNLELLWKELEKNPGDSYFSYQTALTLQNVKRYEEAEPLFERFYKDVPRDAGYRTDGVVRYLYTLMETGRYEKALEVIAQEWHLLESCADFWFFCGSFYRMLVLSDINRYISYLPEIEKSYQRCLIIGEVPGYGSVEGTGSYKAAYNLGVWYEVSGNRPRALECYRASYEAGYRRAKERMDLLMD